LLLIKAKGSNPSKLQQSFPPRYKLQGSVFNGEFTDEVKYESGFDFKKPIVFWGWREGEGVL